MALYDLRNDYFNSAELALGERKTPKTVYAALAVSMAMRLCEDNQERALSLLREEWAALNAAGIVPQKVPKVPALKNCDDCVGMGKIRREGATPAGDTWDTCATCGGAGEVR